MNKGVWVGGGAGLLVLLLLGGYWFTARAPEPQPAPVQTTLIGGGPSPAGIDPPAAGASGATATTTPPPTGPASIGPGTSAPAQPTDAAGTAPWSAAPVKPNSDPDTKPMTREERRAIRAQVRSKMSELLAKGQSATAADAQAFLDDVEKLGQDMFDPRYFSTMREMVGYSARTQDLSRELGTIANSTAPKDVARQQEILAEIRDIGDRISNGAAALQSYARDTAADKKP